MLDKYVQGEEGWKAAYQKGGRKRIWIMVEFSTGQRIYLDDYNQWLELKPEVEEAGLRIVKVGLRYRSHLIEVDTETVDGVYIVRSLMAQFGGDTVHFYTIGLLSDDVVVKTRWYTPALVAEATNEDTLENCFEEAMIYNGKEGEA